MSCGCPSSDPLWQQQARQWALLGPPLRPAVEDIAIAQHAVDVWGRAAGRPPRALVLGATPELASLRWPADSDVSAVDLSPAMLRHIWLPAPPAPGRRWAVQGQWLQLPYAPRSVDLVLGHGSFSLVRAADASALARSIRDVIDDDGRLVLRAYVQPSPRVSPHQVWDEMEAGQFGSFHAFKLRLLMALCRSGRDVHVSDAWAFFRQRVASIEVFAARTGWPLPQVNTIAAYQHQSATYWFPTVDEFRAVIHPAFCEETCVAPSYELGNQCPTFVLRPRGVSGS